MKTVTVDQALDEALRAFETYQSFVITGHEDPDGDCLGSQLALAHLLRQRRKTVHIVNPDPPDPVFEFLPHFEWFETDVPDRKMDVAIILDSGDISRTGHLRQYLESIRFIINIDHHPQNRHVGDVNLVDPTISSVGEIVYRLFKRAGETIVPEVALALYVSLLTDTGGFLHANTGARTHAAAAELIEIGEFDPYDLYSTIYERQTFNSTRLHGLVLANLQRDDGIVWADVPLEFFEQTNTTERDLNDVINYFRRIDQCKIALLFRERPDNTVKINFRAKNDFDLLNVVEEFGGGGHQKAAGATVPGSLPEVRDRVIRSLKEALHGNKTD